MAANRSQGPSRAELDRLAADSECRRQRIERAGLGWIGTRRRGLDAYHQAYARALAQIEKQDLGVRWDESVECCLD